MPNSKKIEKKETNQEVGPERKISDAEAQHDTAQDNQQPEQKAQPAANEEAKPEEEHKADIKDPPSTDFDLLTILGSESRPHSIVESIIAKDTQLKENVKESYQFHSSAFYTSRDYIAAGIKDLFEKTAQDYTRLSQVKSSEINTSTTAFTKSQSDAPVLVKEHFEIADRGNLSDMMYWESNRLQTPLEVNVVTPPVNHAPSGTNRTFSMIESVKQVFSLSSFGFSDSNDTTPNTLQSVHITTLPSLGTLSLLAGASTPGTVTIGQDISMADLAFLAYTPVTGESGVSYSNFTFQVRDDGGTANNGNDLDSTPNTIVFNIAPTSIDLILSTSGATTNWVTFSTHGGSFSGTSGNDAITASVDDITLSGGAGDDIYHIASPETIIIENAGSGIDTVNFYGELAYLMPDNVENVTLVGSSNSSVTGNNLNNRLIGSSVDNVINGGGGDDILTGNGGPDTFIVSAGNGSDIITDFASEGINHDTITLTGYSISSFSELSNLMWQVGNDTVLRLSDTETLTLKNVLTTSLHSYDFNLPLVTSGMTLTFSDDFNSFSQYGADGTATGTWRTKYEFGGNDQYGFSGNGEEQLYVDTQFSGLPGSLASGSLGLNPFSIVNGHLVITGAPIDPSISAYTGSANFTSGLITTEASFVQTYGLFEASFELPEGYGVWPAFWMLNANTSPGAETDILETFGNMTDSVHVNALAGNNSEESGSWVSTGDLSGDHTLSVSWTPYEMIFYFDGAEMYRSATPSDRHDPMYMLLNMAMGGYWPGSPDPATTAEFKIDYVKVYQYDEYTLEHYTLKTSETPTTIINGTASAETLNGTAAADQITGNGGVDTLIGDLGDDTYIVTTSGTIVTELFDSGIDTVRSSVNFTLGSYIENLTLTGTASVNATGNEIINIVTGNTGNNVITGGKGGDILTGGGSHDTFVFTFGDGSDILTDFQTGAGAESDIVKLIDYRFLTFADVTAAMTQTGADVYFQLSEYETLVFRNTTIGDFTASNFDLPQLPPESHGSLRWDQGTSATETIVGSSSNQNIDGGGGADTLIGGKGDDFFVVGDHVTTVIEYWNEGIDTIIAYTSGLVLPNFVENIQLQSSGTATGNELHNRVTGSNGVDNLYGMDGNDYLNGYSGADNLYGGNGDDWLEGGNTNHLTGGTGADSFAFHAFSAFNTITDFSLAQGDKLDISQILESTDFTMAAINDFIQITTSGANAILKVDIDGSGTAYGFLDTATINNGASLSSMSLTDLVTQGHLVV